MDPLTLTTYLQSKATKPFGALPSQISIFQSLLTSQISPSEAATSLATTIQTSKDEEHPAWKFRQLLFALAADFPLLHSKLIELVQAIRVVPPRPQVANCLDRGLWADWRDMHSFLWGRRMLATDDDGKDALGVSGISNAERFYTFVKFSAGIISFADELFEIRLRAFFDVKDGIEELERKLPEKCVLSVEEVRGIDVEIAALWIVYGGEGILRVRNEDFVEEDCRAGLAMKTDLWDGEAGVSEGRWDLWERELRRLAQSELDGRRGELAWRAAEMISNR